MAFELLDSYHMSPEEIDRTPYVKIQEIFLLRRMKSEVQNIEAAKQQFRQQHGARGRGGTRKGFREV